MIFYSITIIKISTGYEVPLHSINGAITSLSEHKGFRKFIKAGADKYAITGTVQRLPTVRAALHLVCTNALFVRFLNDFLRNLERMDMFVIDYCHIEVKVCHFPPTDFKILRNSSYHVHKGVYSSNDYDCESSVTSTDSSVLR